MRATYKFVTGEKKEVETTKELGKEITELDRQIYNNNQNNTNKHVSLDVLLKYDLEPSVLSIYDDDDVWRAKEEVQRIRRAYAKLNPQQKVLVRRHFFDGMTEVEIADLDGVSQSAISQRLTTVKKKLKKLF